MLCRSVHPLKTLVKLGEYMYGNYLKELANRSLEDSERLSPAARQKLPLVRLEKKSFLLFIYFSTNSMLTLPSV